MGSKGIHKYLAKKSISQERKLAHFEVESTENLFEKIFFPLHCKFFFLELLHQHNFCFLELHKFEIFWFEGFFFSILSFVPLSRVLEIVLRKNG